ncbi:MAG: phosphatidylglycerophosphatase A [Phycisphaerales bacterium]
MSARVRWLTLFGLGLSPVAPGTIGSLPPVFVLLLLLWISGPQWTLPASLALLALLASIVCIRFGAEGEAHFGRKDPGPVVVDEVAGQCIPLLVVPWRSFTDARGAATGDLRWDLAMAAFAFVAFRAFDIAKPPPIRNVQRIGGGWGILLDDLIAGALAAVVVGAVAWLA